MHEDNKPARLFRHIEKPLELDWAYLHLHDLNLMHEVISIPLIDLRDAEGNLLTQLRQGERVRILERTTDALLIEALDQPQFTEGWHGYRGWIAASAVQPWRQTVLDAARAYLDWRYLLGGLSDGAIDCSGLVHLAYRAAGIALPRDACDQARQCAPADPLQPADLLFMAKKEAPKKIVHVILYEGNGLFLEATSQTGTVRRVDLATRLSQPQPAYWHTYPSQLQHPTK
jgi:gamma-D-glutamyl-L-lysine dipeptidyl-peptidase